MPDISKTCAISGSQFTVDERDQAFYEKIGVPAPTLCPDERARRRLLWRGKNFYMRKCDLCGKLAMAWFSPELRDVTTYCQECFESDKWDAMEHGRDFDFTRPFFEQFAELQQLCPRHISNSIMNENSEYIISAHKNKDCYFMDELDGCRDCYFGYNIQYSNDIVESIFIRDSELCYGVAKAENCYGIFYSQNVFGCSDSAFLTNCRACKKCLFCANLRNKEYHVFNKPVSKEEFQRLWDSVFTGSRKDVEEAESRFEEFLKEQPFPAGVLVNTEDCTGDYISNSKDCLDCYWIDNCRDCRYCTDLHFSKDSWDVNLYEGEMQYESIHTGPKGYMQIGSHLAWYSSNTFYCIELRSCDETFGCHSLKRKKHCILNKQYSPEEYADLKARIIEHMKKTGEWGEFFPATMSPNPYNLTMAQRFYPLAKEEVLARELKWLDEKETISEASEDHVPGSLAEIPEDILQRVYTCEDSGKKFRFIAQELAFYKRFGLPLPKLSPIERIEGMWRKMGPRKLHEAKCHTCGEQVQTNLPDGKKIACEKCYLAEIY